ncbi:Spo0E like sporulation regulatory protein [Orenia metallireducens]|uniref:Spo0E like sporulation regulatory protein n=1 Tax=Orenia metallireducens TaxID=1413210 RepID=A0A285HFP1_9FIRM|nr:aspartyl-phosphate phosphatase Spo0E family protein [Orenia metallireducens]PRX27706.1 Spo0E like sporulation regulatory protein [Orenia metallireducens]SNY33531.1 Spo0E like sporulation regulatory protein [Orenia metallireducens]
MIKMEITKIIKDKIEKLREELRLSKLEYDSYHPKVVQLSLELDALINIYTKFYNTGLYFYA